MWKSRASALFKVAWACARESIRRQQPSRANVHMTFYQLKKNDGSVGRLGFPPPYQYDAFGSKILFNLLQHQIDVANGCRGIRVILVLGDIPALAAASEFVDVANPRTRTIVSRKCGLAIACTLQKSNRSDHDETSPTFQTIWKAQ